MNELLQGRRDRYFFPLYILVLVTIGYYFGNFILSGAPWFVKVGLFVYLMICASFIFYPYKVFLTLIFLRPVLDLFFSDIGAGDVKALGLFSVLYIIFCVIYFIDKRNRDVQMFPREMVPFYLFILFAFLCVPNAIYRTTTVLYILRFVSLLGIYLIAYNLIKTKDDARRAIATVVLSSVIPVVFGFWQFAHGKGNTLDGFLRNKSMFYHPNAFAFYLVIVLFAIAILFSLNVRSRLTKLNLLLLSGAALFSLITTYTRAAWLGLILGGVVVAIFDKKMRKYIVVMGIIIVIFFGPMLVSRFEDIINPPRYGNSWDFRKKMWRELLTVVYIRRPILGHGAGSSRDLIEKYATTITTIPHNDYIRLLVEFGALGTLPYMLFLGYTVWGFLKRIRNRVNTDMNINGLGLFVTLYFSSISDNLLYSITVIGYFFLILAVIHKLNFLETASAELCE